MNWLLYVVVVITVGGEPPFKNEFTLPVKSEEQCKQMEEKIEADATLSWTDSISVKVESHCFSKHTMVEVDSNTSDDDI